jgi:hypothetical protein
MRLTTQRVLAFDETREKLRSTSGKASNEAFGVGRSGCKRGLPQENRKNGKSKEWISGENPRGWPSCDGLAP